MEKNSAIEMKGITKCFGQVVANDSINLSINRGEILALLGENGSGKTTLMNMLSGIYQPDEGEIYKDGQLIYIRSPREAYEYFSALLKKGETDEREGNGKAGL